MNRRKIMVLCSLFSYFVSTNAMQQMISKLGSATRVSKSRIDTRYRALVRNCSSSNKLKNSNGAYTDYYTDYIDPHTNIHTNIVNGFKYLESKNSEITRRKKVEDLLKGSVYFDHMGIGWCNLLKDAIEKKEIDPNYIGPLGESLLQDAIAYSSNKLEMVTALLEQGADPDYKNHSGETALDVALRASRLKEPIVRLVLKYVSNKTLFDTLDREKVKVKDMEQIEQIIMNEAYSRILKDDRY